MNSTRSQRVALTAVAATSLVGAAGAAMALEPHQGPAAKTVVLDAQAAHKKELRVALTRWDTHIEQLRASLSDERQHVASARRQHAAAVAAIHAQQVAASMAAASATTATVVTSPAQPATASTSTPTAHTTTGASGANGQPGENDDSGGRND